MLWPIYYRGRSQERKIMHTLIGHGKHTVRQINWFYMRRVRKRKEEEAGIKHRCSAIVASNSRAINLNSMGNSYNLLKYLLACGSRRYDDVTWKSSLHSESERGKACTKIVICNEKENMEQ